VPFFTCAAVTAFRCAVAQSYPEVFASRESVVAGTENGNIESACFRHGHAAAREIYERTLRHATML